MTEAEALAMMDLITSYLDTSREAPIPEFGTVVKLPDGASAPGGATVVRQDIPEQLPCACAADEILDIPAITAYGADHNDIALLDGEDLVDAVVDLADHIAPPRPPV